MKTIKAERELALDFLRVTEAAAIESAKTMGQGDRKYSDHVAVDARVGIDEKFVGQFVKCLDRANRRAIGILTFDTRLSNNIGHKFGVPPPGGHFKSGVLRRAGPLTEKPAEAGAQNAAKIKLKP